MLFARWSTKYRGPARTEVNCSDTHCIYDNLWYTNGRFYLLVDGPDPVVRHYLSNHAILDCGRVRAFIVLPWKWREHGHQALRLSGQSR